jgi:hypothetical protein
MILVSRRFLQASSTIVGTSLKIPVNFMLSTLSDDIRGLLNAAGQLEEDAPQRSLLDEIVARGDFRPAEDEAIGFWFARFLTTRDNLWSIINEVRDVLDDPTRPPESEQKLKFFLVGYAAVCLLIRIDRVLLFEVADDSIIQRKLNEPFPEYRIPRKQYTRIFSGFVDQANVLSIRDAMQFARKHRRRFVALRSDPDVGFIATQLPELESSLNPSKLSHFKRAWAYVAHKWRRRGVVSMERVFAKVLEGFGRVASEMVELENKQVTTEVFESIQAFLLPGDIIITRHAKALTNLFFPGVWPHAALYVGTPAQRAGMRIRAEEDKFQRWAGDICVLESRKDGVLLRPLRETLLVDAFVVLRPKLDEDNTRHAIERALLHEGKQYNFDFNFFNSDRVVCTELVYRAYDGIDDIQFPLRDRAGRKTLSAEDILDYALDSEHFTPVAIFGAEDCENAVLYGDKVREAVRASYG